MSDAIDFNEVLVPADPGLFYRRDDINDPRMGERALRGAGALAGAEVALIGCPQDEGVRRNRGRAGAAQGPAEIRRALYRYPVCAWWTWATSAGSPPWSRPTMPCTLWCGTAFARG